MEKYKAIMFSLFVLGILIGGYILISGMKIYQESRANTETNWHPSIDCIRYVYSIDAINFKERQLSFIIDNKDYSDHEISNITIRSGKQKLSVPTFIPPGAQDRITFEDVDAQDNFTLYPDNCELYFKTCFMATKECTGYHQ